MLIAIPVRCTSDALAIDNWDIGAGVSIDGLFFVQLDRQAVNTVAQPGGRRPIFKHMPQMGAAFFAHYFGANHAVRAVAGFEDDLVIGGLEKAGPAATGIKFGIRQK